MKKTKYEWVKHHIELLLDQTYKKIKYSKKAEIQAEVYENILEFIDGLDNIKKEKI